MSVNEAASPSPSVDAPKSYAVTYLSSSLHPYCPQLLAHYYILNVVRRLSASTSSKKKHSESTVCVVGVLEYDCLVHKIQDRLAERERRAPPSAAAASQWNVGYGELHATSEANRAVARSSSNVWSALSAVAPSDKIMRALKASRISTISLLDATHAVEFYDAIQLVAEGGGHFLSNYDIAQDVAPVVSLFASSSLLASTAASVGNASNALTRQPNRFVWLELDHYSTSVASSATLFCRARQLPRPVVLRSPRTYALWLRIQLIRDALDQMRQNTTAIITAAAASHTEGVGSSPRRASSAGRGAAILHHVDGTLASVEQSAKRGASESHQSRLLQIAQIRSTFDVAGGDADVMFLPRYRRMGDQHDAGTAAAVGAAGGSGYGADRSASASLLASQHAVSELRRAPVEIVIEVYTAWMRILAQCGPKSDNGIFLELLRPPTSTAQQRGGVGVATKVVEELLDGVRSYLVELEKLRRRRAMVVQSVVVTASAAARNDFFQSNLVRVVETWLKERFDKVIGQVGNLVGARMNVEPNWRTEEHPTFGGDMRTQHFPYFRADAVMLDGCATPLTPLPVMRCRNEWRRVVQLDPVLFRFRTLNVHLATTIAKLSKRLVCSPSDLSLLLDKELAISTVLRSLPLMTGDTVLLVDPPLDGSFAHVAAFLERRHGVVVRVLELNPYASTAQLQDDFAAALERLEPMLCMMSWVAPSTRVLPVAYFASLCAQRAALTLVDGTDAVGNLSVSVAEVDCDIFIARLDNYMFCPRGVTALVLKPKMHKLLTTLTVSYYYEPPSSVFDLATSATPTAALSPRQDPTNSTLHGDALYDEKVHASPWGADELADTAAYDAPLLDIVEQDAAGEAGATVTASSRQNQSGTSAAKHGSTYGTEWWYTGLSDMSSALAVTQGLQFKKFICFGVKEYCVTLAREAEAYLCRMWQVERLFPFIPPSKHHSILCVVLPRSHCKGASDAAHVQRLFRELRVFVTVFPLTIPPDVDASLGATRSTTTLGLVKKPTLLAVRITVQAYNTMRDIKVLAAAGIRVVSSLGWNVTSE